MKHPRRKQRSVGHYIFASIVVMLVAAMVYFAVIDPYSGKFDPPKTVGLTVHRISFGFKSLVGSVDGRIRSTNDSMQNTVDTRTKRNDDRIRRDTQNSSDPE